MLRKWTTVKRASVHNLLALLVVGVEYLPLPEKIQGKGLRGNFWFDPGRDGGVA